MMSSQMILVSVVLGGEMDHDTKCIVVLAPLILSVTRAGAAKKHTSTAGGLNKPGLERPIQRQ